MAFLTAVSLYDEKLMQKLGLDKNAENEDIISKLSRFFSGPHIPHKNNIYFEDSLALAWAWNRLGFPRGHPNDVNLYETNDPTEKGIFLWTLYTGYGNYNQITVTERKYFNNHILDRTQSAWYHKLGLPGFRMEFARNPEIKYIDQSVLDNMEIAGHTKQPATADIYIEKLTSPIRSERGFYLNQEAGRWLTPVAYAFKPIEKRLHIPGFLPY